MYFLQDENFYGLDERALPTKIAYQLGIDLADQVIADYILNEQRYPETVGIILWASSNSRSHGQCLGEFLYLLGFALNGNPMAAFLG